MTFRVLHVCTGNICRSPMAEHLMREGLRERLGDGAGEFVVESAGTFGGMAGSPMQPFSASTLASYGYDGSAHRARELVADLVEQADLVLTATREHRAAVAVLHPPATRKTFTIREFDRLLSVVDAEALPTGDRVERARALVVAAAGQRGTVRPDRPDEDDVIDPYQGPEAGYVACAQLLQSVLQRPLDLIAG